MADILITDLPPAESASRLATLAVVLSGVSQTYTVGQVLDILVGLAPGALDTIYELADASESNSDLIALLEAAVAAKADKADTDIHALVAKTTPVDADEIRLADSAESFGFKKLTFSNLWVWVKSKISGEVVTPWVAYTPTFTGFGTVSGVSIWSRRVGDTLQIRGRFTAGTSTAVEARMTVGFNGTNGGITSDNTKVSSIQLSGNLALSVASAVAGYTLIEGNVGYITFAVQGASNASLTKVVGSAFGSSLTFSLTADIPISGW